MATLDPSGPNDTFGMADPNRFGVDAGRTHQRCRPSMAAARLPAGWGSAP